MSTFRFIVTVDVDIDIPPDDEYRRTPAQFAELVLWAASLRDARVLDGWADLKGTAGIADVEAL